MVRIVEVQKRSHMSETEDLEHFDQLDFSVTLLVQ